MPSVLGRLDADQNPWISVIFVGIIAIMVAGLAPFTIGVMVSSFGTLFYYSITNISALRLKSNDRMFPLWLPAVGLVGCLALLFTLAPRALEVGIGIAIAGFVFHFLWIQFGRKQAG